MAGKENWWNKKFQSDFPSHFILGGQTWACWTSIKGKPLALFFKLRLDLEQFYQKRNCESQPNSKSITVLKRRLIQYDEKKKQTVACCGDLICDLWSAYYSSIIMHRAIANYHVQRNLKVIFCVSSWTSAVIFHFRRGMSLPPRKTYSFFAVSVLPRVDCVLPWVLFFPWHLWASLNVFFYWINCCCCCLSFCLTWLGNYFYLPLDGKIVNLLALFALKSCQNLK